jgi:hypothetical protein
MPASVFRRARPSAGAALPGGVRAWACAPARRRAFCTPLHLVCFASFGLGLARGAAAAQEAPAARGEAQASDEDGETLVVAPPAPVSAAERQIDADTVLTTPRSSGDDLLRLVPGLLITRHGAEGKGRQLFLRGFDAVHGADVEVTVDGIPWNEASNVHGQGYLDLQTLIPEAVEGIGADKGAFRLDQGPFATAGSVRFRLGVAPALRGARVGYELGSTGRHRAVLTLAPRAGRSFAAAEAVTDEGYGQNRHTRRAGALGRAVLWARGGHEISVWGGGHASRFGEPGTVPLALVQRGAVGFYDSLSPDTTGASLRAIGAVSWTMARADGQRASVLAYTNARRLRLQENFTGFLFDAARGDRVEQRHQALGGGLRAAYERPLGERFVLRAGLDLTAEHIDQSERRLDEGLRPVATARALAGLQGGAGARAGVRWLPLAALRLDAGLRVESFFFAAGEPGAAVRRAHAGPVILPRLAATLFPADAVTAVLAYGRGVRPPEARAAVRPAPADTAGLDLSRFGGGPAGPVVADGIEAGLSVRPHDRLELAATGFATHVAREQFFDHLSATTIALAGARRLGVELAATVWPVPWLPVRADVTAVQARFAGSGRPVPGPPPVLGTLTANAVAPFGLLGGARLLAIAPRPLAHGARAAGAAVVDLFAGWRGARWDVSLSMDNAAGARWREGEFNYASWFDRAEPRSELPRLHYAAGPPRVVRASLALRY